MRGHISKHTIVVFCVGALTFPSCIQTQAPLDLLSQDPAQDQRKIASYYSREAAALRQKSADVTAQAAAYEQMFGHDSEWVQGALSLAQFYEEKAKEKDRLAHQHLGQIGGRSPMSGLIQQ
jgi:hypothetical protein